MVNVTHTCTHTQRQSADTSSLSLYQLLTDTEAISLILPTHTCRLTPTYTHAHIPINNCAHAILSQAAPPVHQQIDLYPRVPEYRRGSHVWMSGCCVIYL